MQIAMNALPPDPAEAMLALMVQSRGVQIDVAKSEIDQSSQRLEDARKQIEDAMARAAEAREDGSFWSDLGSVFGGEVAAIFGAVAAAAVTVATCGTGAPAVVALVAAGLTATASAGRELGLDPKVCTILGAAGAAVGLLAGNAGGASSLWNTVATGAKVAQAGATATSGAASVVAGNYEADALHAEAQGKAAEGNENDALYRFELALDILKQAASDLQRARSGSAELQRTEHEGNTAVIAQIGVAS